MDSSENQMACFRCADCGFECFIIAHFADETDVGIFSHEGAQGIIEICAVNADFALIDCRLHVGKDVFDRIFNCDNVHLLALIDILKHRCNRSALAGTSDSRKQDEPLRQHGDFAKTWSKSKFFKGLDLARDESSSNCRATSSHK